jgi:hypothetical protein
MQVQRNFGGHSEYATLRQILFKFCYNKVGSPYNNNLLQNNRLGKKDYFKINKHLFLEIFTENTLSLPDKFSYSFKKYKFKTDHWGCLMLHSLIFSLFKNTLKNDY